MKLNKKDITELLNKKATFAIRLIKEGKETQLVTKILKKLPKGHSLIRLKTGKGKDQDDLHLVRIKKESDRYTFSLNSFGGQPMLGGENLDIKKAALFFEKEIDTAFQFYDEDFASKKDFINSYYVEKK